MDGYTTVTATPSYTYKPSFYKPLPHSVHICIHCHCPVLCLSTCCAQRRRLCRITVHVPKHPHHTRNHDYHTGSGDASRSTHRASLPSPPTDIEAAQALMIATTQPGCGLWKPRLPVSGVADWAQRYPWTLKASHLAVQATVFIQNH
jgi:hypothetical protein